MSAAPGSAGWCTFGLAGALYGVDVERVQEVLRPTGLTRLPRAPLPVRGLLNLRGQIVPAIDLRVALGLPAAPDGAPRPNLIVRDGAAAVSLIVDTIGDVQPPDAGTLEPAPGTAGGPAGHLLSGVIPLADRLLLVLDLDRTLDHAFSTDSTTTAAGPDHGRQGEPA